VPARVAAIRATIAWLFVFAMRSAAATADLDVPLTLLETAGVPRQGVPASASVPFPRGHVKSAEALWLAGAGGRAVPVQRQVLERWPDGSIRFLLLDFLADVQARGHATYTLHEG